MWACFCLTGSDIPRTQTSQEQRKANMPIAEKYAFPTHAEIDTSIPRTNDFKEVFYVRWGRIHFDAFGGDDLNVKVVLNVYRSDDVHFRRRGCPDRLLQ